MLFAAFKQINIKKIEPYASTIFVKYEQIVNLRINSAKRY